jgi:hypothetical protein
MARGDFTYAEAVYCRQTVEALQASVTFLPSLTSRMADLLAFLERVERELKKAERAVPLEGG